MWPALAGTGGGWNATPRQRPELKPVTILARTGLVLSVLSLGSGQSTPASQGDPSDQSDDSDGHPTSVISRLITLSDALSLLSIIVWVVKLVGYTQYLGLVMSDGAASH